MKISLVTLFLLSTQGFADFTCTIQEQIFENGMPVFDGPLVIKNAKVNTNTPATIVQSGNQFSVTNATNNDWISLDLVTQDQKTTMVVIRDPSSKDIRITKSNRSIAVVGTDDLAYNEVLKPGQSVSIDCHN